MLAKEGLSRSEFGSTVRDRFIRNCKELPSGCTEWTGTKTKKGYGIFRLSGGGSRKTTAHRVSWVIENGDLAPGMFVLHRCDNPSCVNVSHLFIGSAKQNTEDMIAKGRHSWRDKTPWQKLDSESYSKILKLRADGLTQQKVAEMFMVSRALVSMIENGKIQHAASVIA